MKKFSAIIYAEVYIYCISMGIWVVVDSSFRNVFQNDLVITICGVMLIFMGIIGFIRFPKTLREGKARFEFKDEQAKWIYWIAIVLFPFFVFISSLFSHLGLITFRRWAFKYVSTLLMIASLISLIISASILLLDYFNKNGEGE